MDNNKCIMVHMEKNIFELLLDKGISSIPVNSDKKPKVAWKEFQNRLPSQEECKKWGSMKKEGVAVICGAISGGLEIIDIDNKFDVASSIYLNLISSLTNERPELYDKLVIEKSKNKGYHIIYRCKKFEGNQKLARQKDLQGNILTIIETRGEGGYCIIHPSKGYDVIKNNILKVQEITEEERDYLFQLCYQYNAIKDAKTTTNYTKANTTEKIEGEKIGDLYNQKDDFINVLLQHGWTIVKEENDKIHFKRPGKLEKGNSATFLKEPRLFYVFSTNAFPFESECSYSPFAIYTLLEANGDFKQAVKQLANEYPEFKQKTTKKQYPENEVTPFWKFKSNNKDELVISISKVITFLSYNNIYCYYKDKDTSYIVKEVNNVIEIISEKTILKYLQDYVNSLPSDYTFYNNANCDKEAVKDLLKELSVQQFNKIIQNLEIKEIELLKDEKDVCYKCFKNVIVKITANNIELLDYKDIDKKVLKTNIIDYEFTLNKDYEKAMAYQFHKNVTTTKDIFGNLIEDEQRFLALRSALGYLMHNYKNEIDTKAIVLCEEQISDNGGRTGKTLTCKMLEKVGCNLAKINGRKVDFNNRFLFQNVNTDTNIIQFDDTDIKFDFSGLYSIITNGITIEKKNKQAIQLTHQDTPKFVITTNQVLTDESNSGKDRKFEIEFSDYYNDEITPFKEFGCMFFTDWDTNEWNLFFNYMIDNIQLYIKSGLIDYNKKNLKNRKLMIAFDDDKISNFCTNICIEILTEKKNLSSQEILDRYKKTDDSIANNPKINIFNISKTLNKFIAIMGLKAIKNTTFYEGGKQRRGFVYVNRYANSESVLEFLKDNNIEIDTNDVNSINFDTNDTNINTNEVNEATNEIQTEGKIEFTNNNVNDTNINVNSINNDINRNIDIEKDKAIPSLDEIFLEDCDLPF